jgi:hypothetical protein
MIHLLSKKMALLAFDLWMTDFPFYFDCRTAL